MSSENCPFCKILSEKTERMIRETEHTFTILSNPRIMPGHTLVIPKRHVEKMSDLGREERDELFNEVVTLQEKIISTFATGCDISQHYRPFIEQNDLKIDHVHVHLYPRELDDELYMKAQINNRAIFKPLEPEEFEKFKEILS